MTCSLSIIFPLLRIVIWDFLKFANAREPEMSILFLFGHAKGIALSRHHATPYEPIPCVQRNDWKNF